MNLSPEQRQKLETAIQIILQDLWRLKWQEKMAFISQGYAQEKTDHVIKIIESFEPFAELAAAPVYEQPVNAMQQSIQEGDRHADAEWKDRYLDCIYHIAVKNEYFTSDEIVARMRLHHPGIRTHDNRASGGLMQKAAADKWCESTNQKRKSVRPELHHPANQLTVWHSLIFQIPQWTMLTDSSGLFMPLLSLYPLIFSGRLYEHLSRVHAVSSSVFRMEDGMLRP